MKIVSTQTSGNGNNETMHQHRDIVQEPLNGQGKFVVTPFAPLNPKIEGQFNSYLNSLRVCERTYACSYASTLLHMCACVWTRDISLELVVQDM